MFIVIEGIDGAGCETQAKMIFEKLKNHPELDSGSNKQMPKQVRHDNVNLIKFPHYDTPVGKMIKEFLYENKNMNAQEQFLLYTLQFIFDAPIIRQKSQHPISNIQNQSPISNNQFQRVLIADRYFTTTLCYQTLEGFSEKYALEYAKQFGIVVPDMVFFLDVKPETAIKWKYGEDKEKNFREKDHEFIKKTYVKYQDLISRQVWTKWVRINGERSKEIVAKEIYNKILNLKD